MLQPVIFTATLTEAEGPMFSYQIYIPKDVAEVFRQPKGAVRVLCSIKNAEEFPCALNPRGNDYIIIASKALVKKHRLENAVPFKVSLRSDPNDGLLLPEELLEVLLQDEFGNQVFEALLPGRKRGLIYYIRTGKSVDTRIKRSLEIIEKLKREAL
jgi:hypothetical protein